MYLIVWSRRSKVDACAREKEEGIDTTWPRRVDSNIFTEFGTLTVFLFINYLPAAFKNDPEAPTKRK